MSKTGIAAIALALWLSIGAAGPARGQFFQSGPPGRARPRIISRASRSPARPSSWPGPTCVEIDLSVSAASELTADAIVKYRDARRKLRDAFAALKLANVAVEERGLLVDQKSADGQPLLLRLSSPTSGPRPRSSSRASSSCSGSDLRKMDEDARAPARRQAARRRPGRRRPGRAAAAGLNPYYLQRDGTSRATGWSGSWSRTSTSSRRRPTRRRSPMPARGPSGWPG